MARKGYTTPAFNGRSGGGAGLQQPSKNRKSFFGRLLPWLMAGTALAVVMQINYWHYDRKGHAPFVGLDRGYDSMSPETAANMRAGASFWTAATGQNTAVTLLPDHMTVCVSNELADEFNNPAPGSAMDRLKREVESQTEGPYGIAKRHTEPGITYDENKNHRAGDGGHWHIYVDRHNLNQYQGGGPVLPLLAFAYHNTQLRSFGCGTTNGHEDGPENYDKASYHLTHDGTKIPVAPKVF